MNDSNWFAAMKVELREIDKNKPWEFAERSSKKSFKWMWVFKIKMRPSGEISKYKARLVARGFLQKPDINFNEVYAPVTRLETIRIVCHIQHTKDERYTNWMLSHHS